jgi:uncharacterized glyoxalase superfamily protein PhnB
MSEGGAHRGLFGCRPILRSEDVSASLKYYRDALGFTIGWRWSDETGSFLTGDVDAEVGTALVGRDGVQLILVQRAQGAPGMWLHLDVRSPEEIDELHSEWMLKGARILEGPRNRPWGMYEMRVTDLDGHTLRVSSPKKAEK